MFIGLWYHKVSENSQIYVMSLGHIFFPQVKKDKVHWQKFCTLYLVVLPCHSVPCLGLGILFWWDQTFSFPCSCIFFGQFFTAITRPQFWFMFMVMNQSDVIRIVVGSWGRFLSFLTLESTSGGYWPDVRSWKYNVIKVVWDWL